jgi:hypothetical protein
MSVNPSSFNSYSPIIRTQFVGPTPTTHPTAPSEIIKIRVMTQARILDCARLINDAEYNEGSKLKDSRNTLYAAEFMPFMALLILLNNNTG